MSAAGRGRAVGVRIVLSIAGGDDAAAETSRLVVLSVARILVIPEPSLLRQLRDLVGVGDVRVRGGHVPRRERRGGRSGPPAERTAPPVLARTA